MLPNQAAFLSVVSRSEGTYLAADPYRVVYGFSHTIADLRDHPAITGEWMGESIAKLGPAYIGKISTAAGRYQINRPTWEECKLALRLPDFTGPSQDDAALWLIKRAGALDAIAAGDLYTAIELCSGIWASFPGSTSGQPVARMAALISTFSLEGGRPA
jgi:lysozyme